MSAGPAAYVDLSALRHNLDVIRRLTGGHRKIIAMIKAYAYGHGLLPIANALDGVDVLGVAAINEALTLRQAGISRPILVMTGFTSMDELSLCVQHQLSVVVHHPLQLDLLEKLKGSDVLEAWLKVDTGMHRLGFSINDFPKAYRRLSSISAVKQPIKIMTHLADADNVNCEFTQSQLDLFSELTDSLPGEKSISNSAAVLAYQNIQEDIVRPGIMLYGVSPFADRLASDFNLKPVMRLTSKVIAIKQLKQGDKVGYGCTWECPEDMTLGVVAIGYGDGYPRHIQHNSPVLINGVMCPIVGRVSMDMITVDLRHQKQAKVGDEVVLWGADLPIEKIAASAGAIPYELLCQLTKRVTFHYVGNT